MRHMDSSCSLSFWHPTLASPAVERTKTVTSHGILLLPLVRSSAPHSASRHQVIFRSCKLIPTMAIAIAMHRKVFSVEEWIAAVSIHQPCAPSTHFNNSTHCDCFDATAVVRVEQVCVCLGLIFVACSDAETSPHFSSVGLGLVTVSVVADAFLPNIQQRLLQRGESRADVVYVSNFYVSLAMFGALALSGDLAGAVKVAIADRKTAIFMVAYALVAYVAVSFHMSVRGRAREHCA